MNLLFKFSENLGLKWNMCLFHFYFF
jgi:hypothetical protein